MLSKVNLYLVSGDKQLNDVRVKKAPEGGFKEHTLCYVGTQSYCWNLLLDIGREFDVIDGVNDHFHCNVQVGRFCAFGSNASAIIFRTHEINLISAGSLDLMFKELNLGGWQDKKLTFNQKSSVIVQNDVYMGENVTLMPNIIIRNGAVVARNSHVVSDVPPYAIVGGNPAKIIGYRFPKDIIDKMQCIQWWYWDIEKMTANAQYLSSENVELFCEKFYPEAAAQLAAIKEKRARAKGETDKYFMFVDYYEEYNNYTEILEKFLEKYGGDSKKELAVFVQEKTGHEEMRIDEAFYSQLGQVVKNIDGDTACKLSLYRGEREAAADVFIECNHYIMSRTYDAVYFSCLADLLGIEIIFGTDTQIQFEKKRNMAVKV